MKILPAISVVAYAATSSSNTRVRVAAVAVEREESTSSTQVVVVVGRDDDHVTATTAAEEVFSVEPSKHLPPQDSTTSTTTSTHCTTTDSTTKASVSLLIPHHPLEYGQQWSPYPYLVRLFQYFLDDSSPSLLPSSSSSRTPPKTRCLQIKGPHHSDVKVTVSSVCPDRRLRNEPDDAHTTTTCSSSPVNDDDDDDAHDFCYELSEPLHLELGGRLFKHVEDYAYRPVVVTSSSSSVPLFHNEETKLPPQRRPDADDIDNDDDADSLEESPALPRRGWWQWWIPWQVLRDQSFSTFHHSSSYRMNDKAFAGGSHGEIWRGRRICAALPVLGRNCTEETLIFKRLKVEKGFRALEAGLREIHFGSLLRQLPSESSELFTHYVEHFFGNNGELWIVFKDHGLSLRSFLYTSVDAGGFVVFQQSWLWTLMRISIHSKRTPTAEPSHSNGPIRMKIRQSK